MRSMEKSCGAVLFTENNGRRYYTLVRTIPDGICGLPKGHVENGESDEETALREIREETCVDAEILPGFRRQVEYRMHNGTRKQVVYFIARYDGQTARKNPEEAQDVFSLPYEQAISALTFDNVRQILAEAEEWLVLNYH